MKSENHSNKGWYKIHIPKNLRRGLTNREKSRLRIDMYYKGRR